MTRFSAGYVFFGFISTLVEGHDKGAIGYLILLFVNVALILTEKKKEAA